MPKRTPAQSITVDRREDGAEKPKFVTPPIGKPFDFTAAEIKSITQRNPDAFEADKVEEEEDDGLTEDEREAAREIAEQAAAEKAEQRAAAKAAAAAAKTAKPADKAADDDL